MEKGIEEIKKEVLAYCQRVCPHLDPPLYPHGVNAPSTTINSCPISCSTNSDKNPAWWVDYIHVHEKATDNEILLAYRLLGLETAQAVAALTKELDRVRAACQSVAQLPLLEYATDSEEVAALKRELQAEREKGAALQKQYDKLQWLYDGEVDSSQQRAALQILPALREESIRRQLEAEREKSAASLMALESARRYCESGNGRGGATWIGREWYNEGAGTLYDDVLKALEAHKKGDIQ